MEKVFREQFTEFLKTEKNIYNHYFYIKYGEHKDRFPFNAHVSIKGGNNLYIITGIRPSFIKKEFGHIFDEYLKELLEESKIDFEFPHYILTELNRIGQQNSLYPLGRALDIKKDFKKLLDINIDREVHENRGTNKTEYRYEMLNVTTLRYNLHKAGEKQESKDKNIDIELSIINENGVLKPAITFQWYFIKNVYREYTVPIYKNANYLIEEVNRKRKIINLDDFSNHIDNLNSQMVYGFCTKCIPGMPTKSAFLKLPKIEQQNYAETIKLLNY